MPMIEQKIAKKQSSHLKSKRHNILEKTKHTLLMSNTRTRPSFNTGPPNQSCFQNSKSVRSHLQYNLYKCGSVHTLYSISIILNAESS